MCIDQGILKSSAGRSSSNSISLSLLPASNNASPIYVPSGDNSLNSAWHLSAPVLDDNPWLDRKGTCMGNHSTKLHNPVLGDTSISIPPPFTKWA